MEKQDVLWCQLSAWYNKFKDVTIKSKIINLPEEVTSYLLADGLVLPQGCEDITNRAGLEGDSDDEIDWEDDKSQGLDGPSFPEFNKEITRNIRALGGKVFPKLNWSSPKDASWITLDNTLRCTCPRDVYLLMKSSRFVMHDLANPFENCKDVTDTDPPVQYQLVLRRWHNINPSGEFRCFVRNNTLIGICQRQHTVYYPSIVMNQQSIVTDIIKFFTERVQGNFFSTSYVCDLYVKGEGKVYLLDFNPYSPTTDALMYHWDELLSEKPLGFNLSEDADVVPVFRSIQTQGQVQSSTYECYAMPQDFIDLSTGQDPLKLIDFLQMKIQTQGDSSSDEDDSEAQAQSSTGT